MENIRELRFGGDRRKDEDRGKKYRKYRSKIDILLTY